jgi:hypothetical protein
MMQTKHSPSSHKHHSSCPYCQKHFVNIDKLTLHVVTQHRWRSNKSVVAAAAVAKV